MKGRSESTEADVISLTAWKCHLKSYLPRLDAYPGELLLHRDKEDTVSASCTRCGIKGAAVAPLSPVALEDPDDPAGWLTVPPFKSLIRADWLHLIRRARQGGLNAGSGGGENRHWAEKRSDREEEAGLGKGVRLGESRGVCKGGGRREGAKTM